MRDRNGVDQASNQQTHFRPFLWRLRG